MVQFIDQDKILLDYAVNIYKNLYNRESVNFELLRSIIYNSKLESNNEVMLKNIIKNKLERYYGKVK